MSTPPEGFCYHPDFLSPPECDELLRRVDRLAYRRDFLRGRRMRRAYAQFGHAYVTEGRRLKPAEPFPDFLSELVHRFLPLCPPGTPFDQCIVTRYPPEAGIDWHTDAPCFGATIAAVSLGAPATLLFREVGAAEPCRELPVAPGSFYLITGPARRLYQHKVAPVTATRLSLTFRSVAPG
jgi:alkylated DNA repair dioxygenase AlkB